MVVGCWLLVVGCFCCCCCCCCCCCGFLAFLRLLFLCFLCCLFFSLIFAHCLSGSCAIPSSTYITEEKNICQRNTRKLPCHSGSEYVFRRDKCCAAAGKKDPGTVDKFPQWKKYDSQTEKFATRSCMPAIQTSSAAVR